MATTLHPATTALLPQCGAPVVTVRPENVSAPLPVMRLVISAKPPKYGKFVPPLLNVAVNVRCAATAWPFRVTLASTAAPDPPQYRYAATIDAPAGIPASVCELELPTAHESPVFGCVRNDPPVA